MSFCSFFLRAIESFLKSEKYELDSSKFFHSLDSSKLFHSPLRNSLPHYSLHCTWLLSTRSHNPQHFLFGEQSWLSLLSSGPPQNLKKHTWFCRQLSSSSILHCKKILGKISFQIDSGLLFTDLSLFFLFLVLGKLYCECCSRDCNIHWFRKESLHIPKQPPCAYSFATSLRVSNLNVSLISTKTIVQSMIHMLWTLKWFVLCWGSEKDKFMGITQNCNTGMPPRRVIQDIKKTVLPKTTILFQANGVAWRILYWYQSLLIEDNCDIITSVIVPACCLDLLPFSWDKWCGEDTLAVAEQWLFSHHKKH